MFTSCGILEMLGWCRWSDYNRMDTTAPTYVPSSTRCYCEAADRVVELPMIAVNYCIAVVNSIAKVQLRQTYANPLTTNLDLHFAFPTDTDFCFTRLVAHFDGYSTEAVIQERVKAQKEF